MKIDQRLAPLSYLLGGAILFLSPMRRKEKRVIRIVSMRRSGHHPIANWLCRQLENDGQEYCQLNDVRPFRSPFLSTRGGPPPFSTNAFGFRRRSRRTSGRFLIYNFEDQPLSEVAASKEEVGPATEVINLLVIRDPFNLFASRLKGFSKWLPDPMSPVYIEMWKEYAREALGETQLLKNKVTILFSEWNSNRSYRESICARLNIRFSDAGFWEVSRQGHGSSFPSADHPKYSIENRFEYYANDPVFQNRIFQNSDLRDLSSRLHYLRQLPQP